MPETKGVEAEGVVTNGLPTAMFGVQMESGHSALTYVSGNMRKNFHLERVADMAEVGELLRGE